MVVWLKIPKIIVFIIMIIKYKNYINIFKDIKVFLLSYFITLSQ